MRSAPGTTSFQSRSENLAGAWRVGHLGKSFIWGFLFGYVVLRLAGPLGAGTVLAVSLWTGAVASWTAGRRERRAALV